MPKHMSYINRLGYRKDGNKKAVSKAEGPFTIIEDATGKIVYEGNTEKGAEKDKSSGDTINWVDFSNLSGSGKYRIEMANYFRSLPFVIEEHPYRDLKNALCKDMPPARAFVDDFACYSTNEIAIYWNTPAIFTTAWFDR